jgi:WD40 repeat protein
LERTVSAAAFSPDGSRIATAGDSGVIRIWEVDGGELLAEMSGHSGGILDLDWSPDGMRIASASRDRTVGIWCAERFERIAFLRGHRELVSRIVWMDGGETLCSASNDLTVRLWETVPLRKRAADVRDRGRLRAEVESLLNSWLDEGEDPAAVLKRLPANTGLGPQASELAAQSLMGRLSPP